MAFKPNFVRKKKRQKSGAAFWDSEYQNPEYLALSDAPGEDFLKFIRFLERSQWHTHLSPTAKVVDAGCGNGRHLLYLAQTYGVTGYGFDTSVAAIAKAKRSAFGLPLQFSVLSTAHPLPLPDAGTHLALDLMASHYLDSQGRTALRDELHRVLVPGGFLLMKTFLRDDDLHTERLLQDYPGPELGTYIHPVIGVPEYVYDEATLTEFLSERFLIHKIYRSHQHRSHGKARKRRTVSVYAQKDPYQ